MSYYFSALTSISNCKCDHPLSEDVFNLYYQMICDSKDHTYVWVLGHVGIHRNTFIDLAAKHALKNPVNKTLVVPYTDFKELAYVNGKNLWQMEWQRYSDKLHKIKLKVDDSIPSHHRSQDEKSILYSLHISHTF